MIRVKLRGGLGNQLFQLSAGLYISYLKKVNYTVDSNYIDNQIPEVIRFGFIEENKYSTRPNYLDKLYITEPNLRHKSLWYEKKFEALRIKSGEMFTDPSDLNKYELRIPKIKFVRCVRGWFQTQIFANELKKFGFNFNPVRLDDTSEILVKCNKFSNSRVSQEIISVSDLASEMTIVIHVRCYEKELSNTLGILSDAYYINAIKKFFLKYKNSQNLHSNFTSALIISDNLDRANGLAKKIHNLFSLKTFTLDNVTSNDQIAFDLLKRAKNIVIANSTFSWWGAYLGSSSLVMAPQKWYYKSLFSGGLYLDDWETVDSLWV